MHQYGFRITKADGALSLFSVESYFSNSAAIHAARKLHKKGHTLEVWRDDTCIYSETAHADSPLVWPISSGKVSGLHRERFRTATSRSMTRFPCWHCKGNSHEVAYHWSRFGTFTFDG